MKSLLVDALLQANSGDKSQTLTDSGSYDTTNRELSTTANDAVAERSDAAVPANRRQPDDAQELSLEAEVEVEENRNEQDLPLPVATRVPDPTNKGPLLARLTPHACVLLVIITAGFCFAYQHIGLAYSDSGLGASQLQGSGERTAETGSAMNHNATHRFPFLAYGADTDAAEDFE